MTYFEGEHLEARINSAGLEGVFELLQEFAAGQADWPGPITITPARSSELEKMRILIYSILLQLRLKPQFSVKRGLDDLILDRKTGKAGVKVSPTTTRQPGHYAGHAAISLPGTGAEKYDPFAINTLEDLERLRPTPSTLQRIQDTNLQPAQTQATQLETEAEKLLREQVEDRIAKGLPFDDLLSTNLALEK